MGANRRIARISAGEISRVGKRIAADPTCVDPADLEIYQGWRRLNALKLCEVLDTITRGLEGLPVMCIAARLKRSDTIFNKLNRRGKDFKLAQLSDVIGIRILVDSLEDLYTVRDTLRSLELGIYKELDYILKPKNDGYQAIHLILRFKADNDSSLNLRAEVQIRTKRQHLFACLVETIDQVNNANYKTGFKLDGTPEVMPEEVSTFLGLTSQAFSCLDRGEALRISREVYEGLYSSIGLAEFLEAYKSTKSSYIAREKLVDGRPYIMLKITKDEQNSSIESVELEPSSFLEALNLYDDAQKVFKPDTSSDAVLVSAASLEDLGLMYPVYSLQYNRIIEAISQILND